MEPEETDPVEKYLFLLLYAEGPKKVKSEPIRGDLWVQKEIFLIFRNVPSVEEEFEAYFLGPFSELVDEYTSQLLVSDYISKDSQGIKLTEKGERIASELWEKENNETKLMIKDVKSFLGDMTKDELLVFIYSTFEDFAEESEVKKEIERKRLPVSISLFKKHKVSLKRAAAIAKLPINEYMELLKSRNIPIYEYTDKELWEELLISGAHNP